MFKDCKCGRSIPKEWPRCGECTEKRAVVDMHHRMEGTAYRNKVSKRSAIVQSIAKMRAGDTPNEVNPEMTEIHEAQEAIAKILLQGRVMAQKKLARQMEHDNLAPALKEWMSD